MTLVAVADTGPLIHLAEIESLDLLENIDSLLVPQTVIDELETGGMPAALVQIQYEVVNVDEPLNGDEKLDAGERASLALAERHDAVLLTDDLAARDAATEDGIEVRGSVGIIALGYARSAIDQETATDLMRSLQAETSLFVTDAVIERGISILEDSS